MVKTTQCRGLVRGATSHTLQLRPGTVKKKKKKKDILVLKKTNKKQPSYRDAF